MTRRRAILELTLAYALIVLVIWTPNPIQRILYIAAVIVLAAILTFSFESCDKLGLRLTNLSHSLWIVIAALLIAAFLIVIAAHLHTLRTPPSFTRFVARYWGYALWAFVQQILLQDVFLRRLLVLLPSPRLAAVAAATIFALAHLPNPILTPLTFVWGLLSCLLFLRYRNIIPLAIAHATLGITLAITIPSPLIRNMRVGLGFLRYGAHHHHQPPNHKPGAPGPVSGTRVRRMPMGVHRSHIDHTVSTNVCVTAEAPTRLSRRHARP